MGVHGLWKLIEPSGKVVPLETLEGKVLAVDVSIWLHQAIKGFQDSKGAPVANAHLLTLYHRICKLLYFRIKPVFVFDGGVPALKKETIAKRNQLKSKNLTEANKIQKQLIHTLLKHTAVNKVLSEKTKATLTSQAKKVASSNKNANDADDLFVLPLSQTIAYESSEESEYESGSSGGDSSPTKYLNIHDIDEKSVQFRSLPADVRHEILTDLKETRKQNSWGRIHDLPKQSDDFSLYQMRRLLKRYSIQTCLEDAEKEMGGASLSLNELESLMNDHGVVTESKGIRIASDENTRYLYFKDVKKAMESARIKELKAIEEEKAACEETGNIATAIQLSLAENSQKDATEVVESNVSTKGDLEFQKELEAAIKLSLQDAPSTSTSSASEICQSSKKLDNDDSSTTPSSSQEIVSNSQAANFTVVSNSQAANFTAYLENLRDAEFASSDDDQPDDILQQQRKTTEKIFSAARNYMIEYGGLTQAGVEEIFGHKEAPNKGKTESHVWEDNQIFPRNEAQVLNIENKELRIVNETENSSRNEEVAIMSDSESSSDDDFVEVEASEATKKEIRTNKTSKTLSPKSLDIQIAFDTKEELVDDIFSDIFEENLPETTTAENNESVLNKSSRNTTLQLDMLQKTKANSSVDIDYDVENQKRIEESIKLANEQSAIAIEQDQLAESNLLQELIGPSSTSTSSSSVTVDDLQHLKTTLSQASEGLLYEQGTKTRLAANITEQMYHEAQELLRLFGIPYIVAPMEAEAQCAFLNEIALTDGTITDDSDIWLFGGRTVYKNFFNHAKEVLEFRAETIQHHFNLSRDKLISLSMLVGSDYTTGIQGIGPVTALEVLAAFPPKTGNEIASTLEEFRKWFVTGKKVHGRGKAVLRNKLKNIELHDGFPSSSVIKAYLEPSVEPSREEFSWGRPHFQSVIDYARDKFGWNQKKVTETLDPVLKRMNDSKAQKRIHDYFKTVYKPPVNTSLDIQSRLSKRVKKALGTIGRGYIDLSSSSDEDILQNGDALELEAIQVLKGTKKLSKQKNKDIIQDVEKQLDMMEMKNMAKHSEKDELVVKKPRLANLHRKEVIPQKEIAKSNRLQNRMKAIEAFRKSTKGPGFIKKRGKVIKKPKDDAELSESSNSDNDN